LKVRSPALAVLGILLMASAAAIGAVLVHDGEVSASADLSHAVAGEDVLLKGEPEPFAPTGPLRAWRAVVPLLENHSYVLEAADGTVALLTSAAPRPEGVVLAEGEIAYTGAHPDGSGRTLVVVHVVDWRQPILFR
jgi:hypothetical protein